MGPFWIPRDYVSQNLLEGREGGREGGRKERKKKRKKKKGKIKLTAIPASPE